MTYSDYLVVGGSHAGLAAIDAIRTLRDPWFANPLKRALRQRERDFTASGFATGLAEPGLDPMAAPDDVIAELGVRYGRRYEIVEIHRGQPVAGPGGPGDLKWVWPAVAAALLAAWMIRKLLGRRCGGSR